LPIVVLQRVAKRLLDIAGSLIGLLLLSPLWLAICIWIKSDSPGPVLYKRRIIGHNGRIFTAYKFRSMVRDAHELLLSDPQLLNEYAQNLKVAQDPRITKSGRWMRRTSLDELPQLFNVILGDMSLVGPRMLGDVELERYGSDKEAVLSCKPGITGLWQVSGRQTTTFERRRQLDLTYIRNWSLRLDVEILIRTIPVVVSGHGAG
jgi:undecaprenyl-phosphate galactose phosphotransferase